MPTTDPSHSPSPNAFEPEKPGTNARSDAEAAIETLRQQGGLFVEAVRATRMPMALTDPNLPGNPIVFANEAFLKLTGYRMEEVLGQQPHFMNGRDTDPKDTARFAEALRSDQDDLVETVQYRKDGSAFVATVLLSVFKDDEGRVINHFMSWLDVTRRVEAEGEVADLRKAQTALRQSEAKYRTLFSSMDEGFCVIEILLDAAGRPSDYVFLETNPPFERQTGLADAIGRRMRELAPEHEQHWFDIYGRIALTGEPQRFEQRAEALGRWFDLYAFRIDEPDKRHVAILFNDISERKRAELEQQRLEARQAFLLRLSDELRPLGDAGQIQATTTRLLGEHLGVDRSMYAEVEGEHGAETGTIRGQYVRPPAARFPEHFAYGQFGPHTMEARYRGEPLIVGDVENHPRFSTEERIAWGKAGVRAAIVATLAKDGRLVAELGVHSTAPREWTEAEIELVQDVAERTWAAAQRARAEAALRESEERFQLLVRFTDEVRDVTDPAVVAETACRMITEKLGTDRTLWAVVDEAAGEYVTERVVDIDGTEMAPIRWPLNPDDPFAAEHLRGAAVAYSNAAVEPHIPEPARAAMVERGNASGIAVPVLSAGKLRAVMNTSQRAAPRDWSREEVALVQALAERAWAEIERARAATALRESEEKYRNLFESMDEAYAVVEVLKDEGGRWADFRFLDANPAFIQHTSMPYPVGKTATELLGSPNPRWTELYGQALDTGEAVRIEEPEPTLGRIFDLNIFSLDRERNRVAVLFTNITERKRGEEALRESEGRFRLIVENPRDYGIFTTDRDGRIDQWYEGAAEVFGWSAEEAVGQLADIVFTPEDRAAGVPAKEREGAARDGWVPNVRWHLRKDGARVFIEGIASALRDAAGELTGFLKIGQDVTQRRRAEEHQKTLLAELQHRVRNIMAMIRSIARRTAESAETVEDYVQHLEGRISAMARTQALLTREVQAEVDLQGLILDELEMQAAQPRDYVVGGPDVSLPAKAAEVLGLAIHELATNSVKYGALSEKDGRIDVRWALLEGEETPQLSLIWSEFGVTIPGEPGRRGFGTELITQRVPYELQGSGTMEFRPTGLVVTVEFPLADRPSLLQTDAGNGGRA